MANNTRLPKHLKPLHTSTSSMFCTRAKDRHKKSDETSVLVCDSLAQRLKNWKRCQRLTWKNCLCQQLDQKQQMNQPDAGEDLSPCIRQRNGHLNHLTEHRTDHVPESMDLINESALVICGQASVMRPLMFQQLWRHAPAEYHGLTMEYGVKLLLQCPVLCTSSHRMRLQVPSLSPWVVERTAGRDVTQCPEQAKWSSPPQRKASAALSSSPQIRFVVAHHNVRRGKSRVFFPLGRLVNLSLHLSEGAIPSESSDVIFYVLDGRRSVSDHQFSGAP